MEYRIASVLSCSFIATATFSALAAAQTPVLNPANGHYYVKIHSALISWAGAEATAEAMSHLGAPGHLATITSAQEQQWIVANLPGTTIQYWLGGFQDHGSPAYSEPGGGWTWVTGEPWVYTHWNAGEPNDAVAEDFLGLHPNTTWNDEDMNQQGFIVEFEQVLAPTEVFAWGRNNYGQCNVPALSPGTTYVQLAASEDHNLGLCSDGTVVAWGRNDHGQCDVPAPPPGVTYVEVAAGYYHSLARRSDGSIVAWGYNQPDGQCDVPALPSGLSYVEVKGGAFHSLARRSDGSVVGWGNNGDGQCNAPVLPPGLTYVEIGAGAYHSLARRSDGSVVAWGGNWLGQCDVPALPSGMTYVEAATNTHHSLARLSDGSVVAWGSNQHGQCNVPVLPSGVTYVEVAPGWEHSLARRSDGSVVAWGDNTEGQCDVPALPWSYGYVEIAAGFGHSLGRYAPSFSPPNVYCTPKTNSLGCVPTIEFSGTLELSGLDDFVIGASNVLNFRSGLMFWSRTPTAVPFQGGTLCVGQPLVRTHLQDSGGTTGLEDCSGVLVYELTNEYLNAHGLVAGDELYAQYWSRDPYAPPFFTSLSDALHMWVGP